MTIGKEEIARLEKALAESGGGTARKDMPTANRASLKKMRRKYWNSQMTKPVMRVLLAKSVEGEDKSEKMFWLGHELIERGVRPDHTFVLLQTSIWNKFRGRADEAEQIWRCIPAATVAETERVGGYSAEISTMASVEPEPVDFLWNKWLPLGELCVMGGRQGTGKSLLVARLVADLTKGDLPGLLYGHSHKAMVCADEESEARAVVPRLMAAGADLNQVLRLVMRHNDGQVRPLSLPEDLPLIQEKLRRSGARLLVLDTLSGFLVGGDKFDSHNEKHVRSALLPLAAMAHDLDITVLGTMHLRKDSRDPDMMKSFMGSAAFTAVPRSALGLVFGPEGADSHERLLFHTKVNYTETADPLAYEVEAYNRVRTPKGRVIKTARMIALGEAMHSYEELVEATSRAGSIVSKREGAAAQLKELMGEGKTLSSSADEINELAATLGVSTRTLKAAKAQIGAKSKWIDGESFWYLPES